MTTQETILQALLARLAAVAPPSGGTPTVLRDEVFPIDIPDAGVLVLLSGSRDEEEQTLSPRIWHWRHEPVVRILVKRRATTARANRVDDLISALRVALDADPDLGGLLDEDLDPQSPREPDDEATPGDRPVRLVDVPLTLRYSTTSPLD